MLKLITMIPKVLQVPKPSYSPGLTLITKQLQALPWQLRTSPDLQRIADAFNVLMPVASNNSSGIWTELFSGLADQLPHAIILANCCCCSCCKGGSRPPWRSIAAAAAVRGRV